MLEDTVNVLKYWADVESLTAPQAEEVADSNSWQKVTFVRSSEYPWLHRQKKPRKHAVRFGIFSRSEYERDLFHQLRVQRSVDYDTGPEIKDRPHSYLGVFVVDDDGLPVPGTLDLAAYPVFFAILRGVDISFPVYLARLNVLFDEEVQKLRTGLDGIPASPIGDEIVQKILASLQDLLNWLPSGMNDAPRLIVVSRDCKPTDQIQISPVNGFFHDDLVKVREEAESGRPLGLVDEYLRRSRDDDRRDISRTEHVESSLGATKFPAGGWPSDYPLTLMQQVAVNEARSHLAKGGIFSVNGPPGTGKTTLLMDLIAAVVVDRAEFLCSFEVPRQIFQKKWEVQFGNKSSPSPVYAVDPRLLDFVMVVASSNNGAVENITKELPSRKKIGDSFQTSACYLELCANALLDSKNIEKATAESTLDGDEGDIGMSKPSKGPENPVWGLVSVALGKKANRTRFVQAMRALEFVDRDGGAGKTSQELPHSIFLQIAEQGKKLPWQETRKSFQKKLSQVRESQHLIAGLQEQEDTIATLRQEKGRMELTIAEARELATASAQLVVDRRAELMRASEEFKLADRGADFLRSAKPNLLMWVWAALITRDASILGWRPQYAEALVRRRQAELAAGKSEESVQEAQKRLLEAKSTVVEVEKELESHSGRIRNAVERLEHDLSQLAGLVRFKEVELAQDERVRQQMLPNMTPVLLKMRAELFLAALSVQLSFIAEAGGPFKANLYRAFDMLSESPAILVPLKEGAGPHLWATLSLVVPVVSSTFASFGRCFRHLGAGSIGWLFIDEAGQSVPQHAVGALWRSKRAVVVGDPFQVEPVITLDKNIDQELLERHKVSSRFLATASSTQLLADAGNPVGTWMKDLDDERVWVGCPLKVHRRCVELMFSISNGLAYGGSMVLGSGMEDRELRTTADRPLFGPSRWFDIAGTNNDQNHFIPAQAEVAFQIIKRYSEARWVSDIGLPDLFVISPFRSAAEGMRDFLFKRKKEWAPTVDEDNVKEWLKISVGTVHTFQGKESESVVFLLGGESDGAIEWATKTPNILNVAVTRAKRRLYVIGDRWRWMKFGLAMHLEVLPVGEDRKAGI